MEAATTTVAIAGFPFDATARELSNLCRFVPGFQKAQPRIAAGKPVVLFAKFETQESAAEAIALLSGFVFDELAPDFRLKADYAKKEMVMKQGDEDPSYNALAYQLSQPATNRTIGAGTGPPAKRPRVEAYQPPQAQSWQTSYKATAPYQQKHHGWQQQQHYHHHAVVGGEGEPIDTLACKVPPGSTSQELEQYFGQYPGFIALKDNGNNCFLKFSSPALAASARDYAKAEGYLVDLARGNMKVGTEPHGSFSHQPAGPPQNHYSTGPVGAAPAASGQIDTVACAKVPGQDIEMEALFCSLDGFVRIVSKPKNFFIKYASPADARTAVETAKSQGYMADMARQNMVV